jgi:hemoglobin/transferrin/lactoferrin receptor protein
MIDVATAKYETTAVGWLDSFSITGSFNTQREERVNQRGNGDPLGDIGSEWERLSVFGGQALARKAVGSRTDFSVGADLYDERMNSRGTRFLVTTGQSVPERQRIPDGATYLSRAAWAQAVVEAVPRHITLTTAVRYSSDRYRASEADAPLLDGRPLWSDDALDASAVTFRTGAVVKVTDQIRFTGNVSRGFRPPSMTDLGTLGLSGAGFEVGANDLQGRQGMIGSTAGADAVSLGIPVAQLKPETSLS